MGPLDSPCRWNLGEENNPAAVEAKKQGTIDRVKNWIDLKEREEIGIGENRFVLQELVE